MTKVRITHYRHVANDIIIEVLEQDYDSIEELLEDIQDKAENGDYNDLFYKAEEGEYDNYYQAEIDE